MRLGIRPVCALAHHVRSAGIRNPVKDVSSSYNNQRDTSVKDVSNNQKETPVKDVPNNQKETPKNLSSAENSQSSNLLPSFFYLSKSIVYIGVENELRVTSGQNASNLKVSCTGCDIRKVDAERFNLTANRVGKVTVTVSNDKTTTQSFNLIAQSIPNPIPTLSDGKRGGLISLGEIHNITGLVAKLEDFDFDARCSIQSYTLLRTPRREDPTQANVIGPINDGAQTLLTQAKTGDYYQFFAIKVIGQSSCYLDCLVRSPSHRPPSWGVVCIRRSKQQAAASYRCHWHK